LERSEEKFENYFHFLSSRKNWDRSKSKDAKDTSCGYPQMYSVYILRNNNAPSEFVVNLMKKFFHKNTGDAVKIALEISKEDKVLCEIYTRDAAETKVMHVLEFAQGQQQEIKCIMQKSDSHVIKKS
jgi:ATP-dependent Clp protease adaptor protein ClpS